MSIRIAIDGPSGSGKSTLAKNIAKILGLTYVDTGALYRAVGYFAKNAGIKIEDASQITRLLPEISVSLSYMDGEQKVFLNGEDVSSLIRTPEISMYASAVSAVPSVRKFLLEIQKKTAHDGNVIMDGRDIGTVIMPDADVKIFLEPSSKARAHRRWLELREKGIDCSEDEVYNDIVKRDSNDRNREASPAVPAEDAIFLDNSGFTPEETAAAALKIIDDKLNRSV